MKKKSLGMRKGGGGGHGKIQIFVNTNRNLKIPIIHGSFEPSLVENWLEVENAKTVYTHVHINFVLFTTYKY